MPNAQNTLSFPAYLWTLGTVIIALLTTVVSLNYLVDPFLIHQWDTPAARRLGPRVQRISPWSKTYAVSRLKPEVVFLGSSRTEIALSPKTDVFAGKRVFNLAIRGGTLGDAISLLKHTSVFKRPSTVVWGLDYGGLFTLGSGNTDFDHNLIAEDPDSYPLWRTLINIKQSMTMDVTLETLTQLTGFAEQTCPSVLATYGQRSADCVKAVMVDEGGAAKNFEGAMKGQTGGGKSNYEAALKQLATVVQTHCQNGTAFRFHIPPIHALNELYHDTAWNDMENWKRGLVKTFGALKQTGCDIRLMDFSGFNAITTEAIPQQTGVDAMNYYWESSHYKSEVGDKILQRLDSSSQHGIDSEFGVDLNAASIEAHLAKLRLDRDNYCAAHPKETAVLKRLINDED